MQLELSEKTALVTGASAGIGAGIARCLAHEGVRIAIAARRENALHALAADLEAAGALPVTVVRADVTDRSDLERLAAEASDRLGSVDILVNCAGASRPVSLDEADTETLWDEAHALNFTSIRRLTQRLLPGMQARHWGRIINISGSMEQRQLNAAGAAKAALHIWAKSLSCVVAPDEQQRRAFIEVNIPIGRFGDPEELANLAVFLASPLASCITGTVIPVDGGMQHFPH